VRAKVDRLGSTNFEQDCGFFVRIGWTGQDDEVAVGMLAVDHAGPGAGANSEALGTDGHAAIGADLEGGAQTPDVGPPGAARGWTQCAAMFALGEQAEEQTQHYVWLLMQPLNLENIALLLSLQTVHIKVPRVPYPPHWKAGQRLSKLYAWTMCCSPARW